MNIDETLAYIHTTDWRGTKLGLTRIRALLDRLGNPERQLKFVHVTGTNGKGSTCAMLASILHEAGLRTGLYTSPYIVRFNERIQVDGEQIPDDALCALTEEVRAQADAMPDHPSEFELVTAIAMLWFLRSRCDIVVCEVGMGGEFDATNVIPAPEAAVFTNIGLDHISPVEHKDFEDYFTSKLKIFEQCRCAVVNLDSDHADRVLAAAQAGAAERMLTFGLGRKDAYAWASDLHATELGISFTLHLGDEERAAALPFPGDFSVSNALCAAICAEELGLSIDEIVAGLAVTHVPGRMEFYRSDDGRVTAVVDYAHNRLAFESLLSAIKGTFADVEKIAVFGAVGGKAIERRRDLPEVAAKYADRIILTTDDPWTEDPADICRQMEEALPAGFPHETVLDRAAAIDRAFDIAEKCGRRAVVMLLGKGSDATQHVANGYEDVGTDSVLAARYIAAHDAR